MMNNLPDRMTVGDLKKILVDYSDTDNITVLIYKLR